jgi:peroxiredoxin
MIPAPAMLMQLVNVVPLRESSRLWKVCAMSNRPFSMPMISANSVSVILISMIAPRWLTTWIAHPSAKQYIYRNVHASTTNCDMAFVVAKRMAAVSPTIDVEKWQLVMFAVAT